MDTDAWEIAAKRHRRRKMGEGGRLIVESWFRQTAEYADYAEKEGGHE